MVATFFRHSKTLISTQQTSILSAALIITALVFFSAVLGFVRQRALISLFPGEGRLLADAYLIAFRIPDFLFQLLAAGVLSATFIPLYTRTLHRSGEESAHFVRVLATQLTLFYVVFALIVGIFAPEIIRAMTGPKFLPEQVTTAAALTRVMLVSTYFLLLSNFLSSVLQSHKRFLLPALSPIVYNLGIILGTIFLSPVLGIWGPAIGVVIGALLHFAIQIPACHRIGIVLWPVLPTFNEGIREVYRLMVPRGATLTTNYIEDFVALYIATSLGSTLVLLYTSAYSLAAAPIRFFGVSIAQAALPFLTEKARDSDIVGFKILLTKTLHQIAFFMFPAGALLLVLRIPIVRLIFGARELPWADTVSMGRLVAVYSLSIAALAMTHVVLRAYYALKETRIPFFIAFVTMGVNIVIMTSGSSLFHLGLLSVAIGPSIAAVLELILLLVFLLPKIGMFSLSEFFLPQLKIIIASLLMGISLYVPMKFFDQFIFDTTRVVGLLTLTGVVSLIGIFVYLLFCALVRVEQLSVIASLKGRLSSSRFSLAKTSEVLNVESREDV